MGLVLACAVLQQGDWLGLRCCPTGPPSNVFGYRGTPPAPPGGNQGFPAPCLWGTEGAPFVTFRGVRGEGGFRFGLRRPSAGGLAWPALLSHRPTLQRFWKQGDSPCTPGGGCAPCTLLGERGRRRFLAIRRVRGEGQEAPAGRMVLLWLAPSFSGGIGLACAVVPPAHPPMFLGTGGHAVPPAGAAPLHPAWGTGGALFCCLGVQTPILTFPRVQGQGQSSPLHPAWGKGASFVTWRVPVGGGQAATASGGRRFGGVARSRAMEAKR